VSTLGARLEAWRQGIALSASERERARVDTVRYQLTPQMQDYDRLLDRAQTRWLPFLMFFQLSEFRSPVVNTDRLGFRHALHDGLPYSLGAHLPAGNVNLLVGGSTAMGLGATTDAATVPSRLAADGADGAWLNLGGRGFTSTQELLLFMLHGERVSRRVENIVLLSGLNNLVLAGMNTGPQPRDYGLFFFSDDYRAYMENSNRAYRSEPASLVERIGRLAGRLAGRPDDDSDDLPVETPKTLDERIALAVALIRRDLVLWSALAKACGAKLAYCLQPLASWAKPAYCAEETKLFDALDAHPANASAVLTAIQPREVGEKYARALDACCRDLAIPFWDLNRMLSERDLSQSWTFVDRAHLTDEGYALIAELIRRDVAPRPAPPRASRPEDAFITHVWGD
jgi:hypothetical protein